jgi:hypothetical protein
VQSCKVLMRSYQSVRCLFQSASAIFQPASAILHMWNGVDPAQGRVLGGSLAALEGEGGM